jgi:hypothetical protein
LGGKEIEKVKNKNTKQNKGLQGGFVGFGHNGFYML